MTIDTNDNRTSARIAGILFLVAMAASLSGGILLDSIMTSPESRNLVLLGVLLEIINNAAVIGIAAALYPVLRNINEGLAAGYTGFRIVETVVLSIAVIPPLTIAAGISDAGTAQSVNTVLLAVRDQMTGLLVPIFFSLGAFILYSLMYTSKLTPRFLSLWGLIAVFLMLLWNLLGAFGISLNPVMAFVLPIIANEIVLGFWLIIKGFSSPQAISNQ